MLILRSCIRPFLFITILNSTGQPGLVVPPAELLRTLKFSVSVLDDPDLTATEIIDIVNQGMLREHNLCRGRCCGWTMDAQY